MSDITELREALVNRMEKAKAACPNAPYFPFPMELAVTLLDELDRLRAPTVATGEEVERVREALKPFADCCVWIADDEDDEEWAKFRLLIKDYRRAHAALCAAPVQAASGVVGEKLVQSLRDIARGRVRSLDLIQECARKAAEALSKPTPREREE